MAIITAKVERAAFDVEFTNYRRTPAFLTRASGHIHVGHALRPEPVDLATYDLPSDAVIKAGEKWMLPIDEYGGHITQEEARAVLDDRLGLWIYGYLEFRDFLHNYHREPFLRRFIPHRGQALGYVIVEGDGPEAYFRRF